MEAAQKKKPSFLAGGSTEVSMGGGFWDRPWRMDGIIGRMCIEVEEFGRQEHEDRLYLSNSNWDSFVGAKDEQKS